MRGKYLLDTSVIIGLFAKDEATITQLERAKSVFIPSIAVGELHYGARKSARVEANLEQINRLVAASVVLPSDGETAYWYGIVKDRLRRMGKPIPENDIWIAAIALQHHLTLATRDKHFQVVEGLRVTMW